MSVNNVQFAVASHILTVLAYRSSGQATSKELAASISAHPTFVRKAVARLSKAGLVTTTRGTNGTCTLNRSPEEISLLDVYLASDASPVFTIHSYPVEERCEVSVHIKSRMDNVLQVAQAGFEKTLSTMTLRDLLPNTSLLPSACLQMDC